MEKQYQQIYHRRKNPFFGKKHSSDSIRKIVASNKIAISKPEILVEKELKKRKIKYEYSVIFCYKQFDFGVGPKKYKILLEVQGDYWRGNPEIYKELNDIQKANIEKDLYKKELAIKYKFKLFYIWEKDILNKDFSILDEVQEYINEIRINSDL